MPPRGRTLPRPSLLALDGVRAKSAILGLLLKSEAVPQGRQWVGFQFPSQLPSTQRDVTSRSTTPSCSQPSVTLRPSRGAPPIRHHPPSFDHRIPKIVRRRMLSLAYDTRCRMVKGTEVSPSRVFLTSRCSVSRRCCIPCLTLLFPAGSLQTAESLIGNVR